MRLLRVLEYDLGVLAANLGVVPQLKLMPNPQHRLVLTKQCRDWEREQEKARREKAGQEAPARRTVPARGSAAAALASDKLPPRKPDAGSPLAKAAAKLQARRLGKRAAKAGCQPRH